jgi:hypothetical protein
MWIFSIEILGLVFLLVIAVIAVLCWRVRVWLDRWADAMIACFPELLQLGQGKQIKIARKTAPSPHTKTRSSAAAIDGRARYGMARHHFEQSANAESSSAERKRAPPPSVEH